MAPTFRRQSLAGEMLVLQLAIVVVVLLAVAAVSLAQSRATFNRVEGRRVTALAEQLAAERRGALRVPDRTALDRLASEDAADVATVLGNLVDDAVDAAAGRGDEHEAWVEVELRQDAASVEIVVRDSGPGVAPELARDVFDRGFTTKAARQGERGIGLALTRLVCERHGGEISVTNTPEGAMFTARMTVSHLTDVVAEGAAP